MRKTAIRVTNLRKTYGHIAAVRGVDLEVSEGEVFGLLGPNGAGKTTIVEILEGHRQRTSGEVEVLGYDPARNDRRLKERLGIVLQSTGVEPYLTVEEAIELYRGYYPHPRPVDEILQVVGLDEQRTTRVRKLSGGQQRRLDVAVGLAGDPELLFLDEPTTGFDPSARRSAWEVVKNLQSLGKTVFLTTHYMDEAEYLADRVAIIVRGEIVATGASSELAGLDALTTIRFRLPSEEENMPKNIVMTHRTADGQLTLQTATPTRTLYELTGWANERGLELLELNVSRPSLEDVYLSLVAETETNGDPQ